MRGRAFVFREARAERFFREAQAGASCRDAAGNAIFSGRVRACGRINMEGRDGPMKTILLIDDSMIQLRILQGMLRRDYNILMAASGFEGIEMAKQKQPDLILLDYDMPVMGGRETLKNLRDSEKTREIPVIFLTGVDERREIEAVLKLRPQGYLLKPVEQDRLFETIRKILGKAEKS